MEHRVNPRTGNCVMCGRNAFNRKHTPECDYRPRAVRDMFGNDLTKADSFGTPRADDFMVSQPVQNTVCPKCGMNCFYQPPVTAEERMEWHDHTVHQSKCEACDGRGWLLMDNSDHGLRIERCDACEMFMGDEAAVTYVANALMGVEKALKVDQ